MRIIHFPKFIAKEEMQECSLRNCSVVIDGQNYLYTMYEKSEIPFVFGCDTNEYAKYLRRQFEMFKRANVKCYIVLKGGDSDIEKKIEKFQHLIFDFDTNREFVPPIFLKDATSQALDDMGIDHAFCVMESKDECVALAQKLECPVISLDIEFCFRRTPYIPHPTMVFNEITNSIQCRQYKLKNFLQKNSMTEEKTAIFATLSDSTIFPLNFFQSLLRSWGVLHTNLVTQYKKLIQFLSKLSEQEIRNRISRSLSNDHDRNKFWLNYHKILTNMRHSEAGHVTDYLINSKLTIVSQDPEWFEKGVLCKHISALYVNLYKWKVIEGSWVIEDKNSQDSHLLAIDIVKYAYNLLTNYRGGTFKLYQNTNSYIEIDADDSDIRKPRYYCNVSVFENGWDYVKRWKLFEHFLSENKINIEVLDKLPADAAILFIALVYFARKKQLEDEDVTKEVYAVVLSYVMLNFVLDKEDWINVEDRLEAKRVTAKYYEYNEDEAKIIIDGEALKRLAEFQFCIQHMNYLNTLCGSSYKPTQYRKLYNGTFIFKMFCDMRDKNSDVFVNQLFQSAPSVLIFIKKLFGVYRELLVGE